MPRFHPVTQTEEIPVLGGDENQGRQARRAYGQSRSRIDGKSERNDARKRPSQIQGNSFILYSFILYSFILYSFILPFIHSSIHLFHLLGRGSIESFFYRNVILFYLDLQTFGSLDEALLA